MGSREARCRLRIASEKEKIEYGDGFCLRHPFLRGHPLFPDDLRIPEGLEDRIVRGGKAVDRGVHDGDGHVLLGEKDLVFHAREGFLHQLVETLLIHKYPHFP